MAMRTRIPAPGSLEFIMVAEGQGRTTPNVGEVDGEESGEAPKIDHAAAEQQAQESAHRRCAVQNGEGRAGAAR